MKIVLLSLTYLVGAGELILATYFWVTNSKNEIRRVMALLAFATGVWVVMSGLTSYVPQTPITTIYMRFVFAAGVLLVTALLHLTLVYPFPIVRLDRLHAWLLYVPAIFISFVSFTSNAIVAGFTGSVTDSGRIIPGPLYNSYNVYVFLVFLAAIILLAYRWQKSDGMHRKNLQLLFWSIVIGGMPGVVIDLLIPVLSKGVYPNADYGAISTVLWVGATTYIISAK